MPQKISITVITDTPGTYSGSLPHLMMNKISVTALPDTPGTYSGSLSH